MKHFFLILSVLFCAVYLYSCTSCAPAADLRNYADNDLFPPVIETILPLDENTVRLDFNENVILDDTPVLYPGLGPAEVRNEERCLIVTFENRQTAGTHYTIEASVSDETGNSMSFLIPFYGFNPDLPELLINEFTTQGSSTHPDVVELLVLTEGNPAGIWVVEGTTDYPEQGISLPSFRVEAGDYILIHFKPQGIEAEIDESDDELDLSGGLDASEIARDFWVPGGRGLSGNNGVLAVYSAPGGSLIDSVLYSNRTSASDDKYAGFGSSRTLDKTIQLQEEGGWVGTGDGGALRPEDAVNPDDSTATRSICRNSTPADTDTAADWHITPTSGYSFGTVNTDDVYE